MTRGATVGRSGEMTQRLEEAEAELGTGVGPSSVSQKWFGWFIVVNNGEIVV